LPLLCQPACAHARRSPAHSSLAAALSNKNTLPQLGAAGAVLGITGIHLAGITSFSDLRTLVPEGGKMCLLSDTGAHTMCIYAYALGAVSIVFTLAIGLMQVRLRWCGG
jgi:hypothetical protein